MNSYEPIKYEKTYYHDVDKMLNNKRTKFGSYHKAVFHIHTPESYDFKLLTETKISIYFDSKKEELLNNSKNRANNIYSLLTGEDLYEIAIELNLFNRDATTINYLKETLNNYPLYDNLKEYITYMLIAKKLLNEKVGIAVVTDHNCIKGYEKLCKAIDIINNTFSYDIYTDVFLGIEITCADKSHVVGIFENTSKIKNSLDEWLTDNIMDRVSGTFQTSFHVLKNIYECGGIGYIAHINSSEIFTKTFLSGAYKKELFGSDFNNVIGVSNTQKIERIEKKLKDFTKKKFCFLLDEDSHSLDMLAEKPFWIKGQKRDFSMLKNAIRDHDISIQFDKPVPPNVYIQGICVKEGGFLSSKKDNEDFVIRFSDSLNCFIGGRGSGKSTVLNSINFILSQNVLDESVLENICRQGRTIIKCIYGSEEYYVSFIPPIKEHGKTILSKFNGDIDSYQYDKKFTFNKINIRNIALKEYIQVFTKMKIKKENYIKAITGEKKRALLSKLFYRKFSVNELVNDAGSNDISFFLEDILFKNKILSEKRKIGNITTFEGLLSKYDSVPKILEERKNEVYEVLDQYNQIQDKQLFIEYQQNFLKNVDFDWIEVLSINKAEIQKYFEKYNIKTIDLIEYLKEVSWKKNPLYIYIALYKKEYNKILDVEDIKEYIEPLSKKEIDSSIKELSEKNIETFLNILTSRVKKNEVSYPISVLRDYLRTFDNYNLFFNINNRESTAMQKPHFKSVKELSLGQKVVAMLSFILSYSDFSEDYTPLIIDQPEDNLDNRYIYRNLVNHLKLVKSKRQVIIATHSSTIVINSKAEQVIVMESNDENGWVRNTGYPTEKPILKDIINLLEGGESSFLHKSFLYKNVLKKL